MFSPYPFAIDLLYSNIGEVGKSSLISTFVSRHFSEHVPGILTRVSLPPDPSLYKCTTTIIDTQEGDTILSNALTLSRSSDNKKNSIAGDNSSKSGEDVTGGISESNHESAAKLLATASPFRNVDAIMLVYDLGKIDTFHRLEQHWLPLIEQCYNGELPVIIAGNKLDMLATSSANSPSREQIISLLRRYKFVRQCMKCSAKDLVVDEVFLKAQHSVLYPIYPLYDLSTGKLTAAFTRALTRIFRIYDMDRDGLLSDEELNTFQQKIWGMSLIEKDFTGWKNMVTQHDGSEEEDVICDGKFTLAGFLAIFDVLITSQNRLEVPWKVLRVLGYDDELTLTIPESICPMKGYDVEFAYLHPGDWRLTRAEIDFLTGIFFQFESEGDGTLSSTDIHSIFSVLESPYSPWASERGVGLFRDCFSMPLIEDERASVSPDGSRRSSSDPSSPPSSPSSMISASGVTITSSPLPSVVLSKESESILESQSHRKKLTLVSWINKWHMLCTISPSIARAELYRLGHVFEPRPVRSYVSRLGRVVAAPLHAPPVINMPTTFVRAIILGGKNSRKRGLVELLHQWLYSGNEDKSKCPTTSCSVSKIIRQGSSSSTMLVQVILTEVPALDMTNKTDKSKLRQQVGALLRQTKGKRPYNLAVLAFDSTSKQSLQDAIQIEREILTDDMPRVFVGTTTDTATKTTETELEAPRVKPQPICEAYEHCECMELEPPFIVSLGEETKIDSSLLEHLVNCTRNERQVIVPFRSTPHGERKKRAARRRKVIWIGGIVSIVLGLTLKKKLGFLKFW